MKRILATYSILILTFLGCNENLKPVGGPCSYEDFEVTGTIREYEEAVDGERRVIFDIDKEMAWLPNGWLDHSVSVDDSLFTTEIMDDPETVYMITGQQMTSGSCTPIQGLEFRLASAE